MLDDRAYLGIKDEARGSPGLYKLLNGNGCIISVQDRTPEAQPSTHGRLRSVKDSYVTRHCRCNQNRPDMVPN